MGSAAVSRRYIYSRVFLGNRHKKPIHRENLVMLVIPEEGGMLLRPADNEDKANCLIKFSVTMLFYVLRTTAYFH
jgi:hypothetical protein